MAYFEATAEQKQLADIGRAMMDFSEEYGIKHGLKAVTDNGLATLNNLSHVGSMLTRFGTTFGPRAEDFTADDQKLIADWMQKKVDIERK
jgi:hypothetical protein